MNLKFYGKALLVGCLLGFLFMTLLAWGNDVLITMLIGANWDWVLETINVTTFAGWTLITSIPRVGLYVETNVFIWKNLVPWLCALCIFIGGGVLNKGKRREVAIQSFIFGIVAWGCTCCWFSIEDWWGFLLRDLFPTVDTLHTLPWLFPYANLGHP